LAADNPIPVVPPMITMFFCASQPSLIKNKYRMNLSKLTILFGKRDILSARGYPGLCSSAAPADLKAALIPDKGYCFRTYI
jgi:hypothetical protein